MLLTSSSKFFLGSHDQHLGSHDQHLTFHSMDVVFVLCCAVCVCVGSLTLQIKGKHFLQLLKKPKVQSKNDREDTKGSKWWKKRGNCTFE